MSPTRPSDDTPEFIPMSWTLGEIRAAIPPHLFVRDTRRGLLYLVRDVSMALAAWKMATWIDPYFGSPLMVGSLTQMGAECARWLVWGVYFWFQGLIFTGIWVIGHECGHGAFSPYSQLNDVIGFITHTFLWTPYFSWKISHHRHHINHASMERDEVYVPKTRSDLGLPSLTAAAAAPGVVSTSDVIGMGPVESEYEDMFGDTPLFTLFMLVRQQLLAFPAYLREWLFCLFSCPLIRVLELSALCHSVFNVSGQKDYPKWTNHFDPGSILFTQGQRNAVVLSNMGILGVIFSVSQAIAWYGISAVVKYYLIPWLAVTHWFIMITYLHHTDPDVPHYRNGAWNYQRGAAATMDRPFLGWQGRFFLHDVAHYHVIHHFFPKMPFYHGEEATKHLKGFIGEQYLSSRKGVFRALWDNYRKCQFVEDQGDIVFYRDKVRRRRRLAG